MEFKLDTKVADKLLKSYEDQGHRGYSYGVAIQAIIEYLSGNMDNDDRNYVMSTESQKGIQRSVFMWDL